MMACGSCGKKDPGVMWCDGCGAALPLQDELQSDAPLSLMPGVLCARCDSYNAPGTSSCAICNAPLENVASASEQAESSEGATELPWATVVEPSGPTRRTKAAPEAPPAAPSPASEALSAQPGSDADTGASKARFCFSCGSALMGTEHVCKLCGADVSDLLGGPKDELQSLSGKARSGPATQMLPRFKTPAAVPERASATQFFGAVKVERFARLRLIRGHQHMGTEWRIQASKTPIGRSQGWVLFPDDSYLAANHCSLEFRGDDLWIATEASDNGVFVRIRGAVGIEEGDEFIAGVQRFLVETNESAPQLMPPTLAETPLYASQVRAVQPLRLKRQSADPNFTETFCRPQRLLSIGRTHCDLMFPDDPYLSLRHANLYRTDDGLKLEDLQSRNGTYLRIREEKKLQHGDILLMGEQVLRLEINR